MYNVICLGAIHEQGYKILEARPDLVRYRVLAEPNPETLPSAVADAHAIIVRHIVLPREVLSQAPDLKVVSRHGVGTDTIDVAYLSSRNIPMAIAVDSNVDSVAEHTVMMMLALAKDAVSGDRATRLGNYSWRDARTAFDLTGKTVLVLGMGRIGRRVAALCLSLGMRILACDPFVRDQPEGVQMVADFREHLHEADVMTLHLPGSSDTVGLIGRKELAAMKPGSILVNCARGGIVDETDLYEALKNGPLRAAGLDVFSREPPDVSHPLFGLENVLLSPHNAALSEECAIRMAVQAAQNVIACLEGTLPDRVIFNRGQISR